MEREHLNFYLQQVSHESLASLRQTIEAEAEVKLIQQPVSQTLLLPVKDPVTEGTFYGGEILVSSAIVQVNGVNGWAMVMDDQPDLAVTIAIMDGAFAAEIQSSQIIDLCQQGEKSLREQQISENSRINSTRVSFDLL